MTIIESPTMTAARRVKLICLICRIWPDKIKPRSAACGADFIVEIIYVFHDVSSNMPFHDGLDYGASAIGMPHGFAADDDE